MKHLSILVIIVILFSCCNKNKKKTNIPALISTKDLYKPTDNLYAEIQSSQTSNNLVDGSVIIFKLKTMPNSPAIDSVQCFMNGRLRISAKKEFYSMPLKLENEKMGQTDINIKVYYRNMTFQVKNFNYVILSDVEPAKYSYKIIKKYPHDDNAYTQGLVWQDGVLYESTGRQGASSLRKTNLLNGEVIQSLNLNASLFGEGICLFNDKIYQLTWKSYKGFVYQKDNFKLITEFEYFTDGWGLTSDGKNLIMGDGSNKLYFLDPVYFSEVSRIEVYDNNGPVDSLNELEYINDKIYANIYGHENIAIINPRSGKVEGLIDLNSLMPKEYKGNFDKVLNGIAYNPVTKHLYVTGKLWPNLYEIAVIP